MQIRSQYLIPGIIFLVSFCLHLSLISKGPVTIDCLNLAVNAQATLIDHHLHYLEGSGYPLMVLLGSVFIFIGKHFGVTDPVLAVNFIGVLFGSVTILIFYLLTQEICDSLTAILASFILLLNPVFLDVSTYGINHTPSLCFLLLGLISLLQFQTTKRIAYLLLSALCFGLMGATRLPDLILTFPAITFMFILGLKTNTLPYNKHTIFHFFLFIMTIIFIITFFHLPYFLSDHTNYALQANGNWKLNLMNSFQGLFSDFFIKKLSFLTKTFNTVGILCFIAGLFYTMVFNKKLLAFTILWWMIPLGLFLNIITTAPRYFNIFLPAIIIPISIFLAHFLRHKRIWWKIAAIVALLILIFPPLMDVKQVFVRRHGYALMADYYRWVAQSTSDDATIIASDDKLFVTYYSKRNTLEKPVAVVGHLSTKELIDFKKGLDDLLNKQKPVYTTTLGLIAYDHYLEFEDFMRANYDLIPLKEKPLELWYKTPYDSIVYQCTLFKVTKKN